MVLAGGLVGGRDIPTATAASWGDVSDVSCVSC